MIHGDDIYVTTNIEGTQQPIAAAKSGNLDIDQSFINACAPTEARTFRKIPTTYDWSISCECLMTTCQYAKLMLDALRNGTELTIQFIVLGFKVVGSVYVKSCNIAATKGNLAKLNVSFEGSGPLEDGTGWDFINGTLFTYTSFADGTHTVDGSLTDGTLAQDTPSES